MIMVILLESNFFGFREACFVLGGVSDAAQRPCCPCLGRGCYSVSLAEKDGNRLYAGKSCFPHWLRRITIFSEANLRESVKRIDRVIKLISHREFSKGGRLG